MKCGKILTAVGAFFALVMSLSCVTLAYDEVVIVIDPGHGGPQDTDADSGCVYNGIYEKDENLITAWAMSDELNEYGNVSVFMTRTDDTEMSIEERADFAANVNADLVVSVHYNASTNHNFFGAEIFTSAFGDCFDVGNGVAERIMDNWRQSGEFEKGIKTRLGSSGADYYGLIRMCQQNNIPAIILEHGYLDNEHDSLRLSRNDALVEKGRQDAAGIAEYFGLEKGIVKETVQKNPLLGESTSVSMPDESEPRNVELEILDYDSETGDVEYAVSADEPDSGLIYYGFSLEEDIAEDTVFDELLEWDIGSDTMEGTFHVEPGYEGCITARVYNSYELFSDSESIELKASESDGTDENEGVPLADEGEDNKEYDSSVNVEREKEAKEEVKDTEEEDPESAEIHERAKKAIEQEERLSDKSFTGLVVAAGIVALIVVMVIMAALSNAMSKIGKKKKRKVRKKGKKTNYDWMES